jgi:hypothetical protein
MTATRAALEENGAFGSVFSFPVTSLRFAMIHRVSRGHGLVMLVMRGFHFAATTDSASSCATGEHDQTGHAPSQVRTTGAGVHGLEFHDGPAMKKG